MLKERAGPNEPPLPSARLCETKEALSRSGPLALAAWGKRALRRSVLREESVDKRPWASPCRQGGNRSTATGGKRDNRVGKPARMEENTRGGVSFDRCRCSDNDGKRPLRL